jgi:hypothetical protein
MTSEGRQWARSGGLVLAAGFVGVAVAAEGPSEADRKALRDYPLSMDRLRHFGAADKRLYVDAGRDPGLKAEIDKMAQEEPQNSLADLEAKLARHPRVEAYYKQEGLSDREAIVIPLATMEAMGAVQTKGAGQASPAQMEFVKQHEAEIQSMLDEWFKEEPGDD